MAPKQLPDDFREFIQCLNEHDVRYLLVGGWAVGIYGNPRATKDIDFLIGVDDANIGRLQSALREFGAPTVKNSVFQEAGNVYRIGSSPIQIDIINQATGIDFDDCYARRETLDAAGVLISTISKADLVRNKKASGRLRDLADVEFLEEN
jgi:hypothetical protein